MADILTYYISALVGSACFAVIFRTPKRYLPQTTFVGFISCVGMRLCPPTWHIGFSTFVTSLVVACLSHLFARVSRAPAQCFLIPGVIFLVPGTVIYRSFSAALEHKMDDAMTLGLSAASITVAISFGLLIANWLVPARKTL